VIDGFGVPADGSGWKFRTARRSRADFVVWLRGRDPFGHVLRACVRACIDARLVWDISTGKVLSCRARGPYIRIIRP